MCSRRRSPPPAISAPHRGCGACWALACFCFSVSLRSCQSVHYRRNYAVQHRCAAVLSSFACTASARQHASCSTASSASRHQNTERRSIGQRPRWQLLLAYGLLHRVWNRSATRATQLVSLPLSRACGLCTHAFFAEEAVLGMHRRGAGERTASAAASAVCPS